MSRLAVVNSYLTTFSNPVLTRLGRIARLGAILRAVLILGVVLSALPTTATWADNRGLFSPPQPTHAADEILLVNTRPVGTVCTGEAMSGRLQCEQYAVEDSGVFEWRPIDWRKLTQSATAQRPTVVYIHGNRVERGEDRSQGLQVYSSLVGDGKPEQPIRFIIWSWAATQIRGPVKDYKLKANRTRPAGWQLAWFVDQLPAETPVSLFGYSYGARVASAAMHFLGGGSLGSLQLSQRLHSRRAPIRGALVAAAFDADWIQPNRLHGRALSKVDKLVLVTNRVDPAMRFFHLSNGRGRVHALGKQGVAEPQMLGAAARRLQAIDVSQEVGRSHALADYLSASGKMAHVWRQLMTPSLPSAANVAAK